MKTFRRTCAVAIACAIIASCLLLFTRRKANSSSSANDSVSLNIGEKLPSAAFPVDDHELVRLLDESLYVAEHVLASGEKSLPSLLSSGIEALYRDLYTSLNWDRLTGELRNDDPYDFADFGGMNQRMFEVKNGKLKINKSSFEHISFEFNSNRSKLEMMHPAEDFGSFLATVYLSDHMGTPANNIVLAVRNQMQRGNFEPAAKYLYFRQIEGRFEAPKRVTKTALGDITFKEVVEAIRGTDGVVIPELTVKAVELLQRGAVTIQKLEAAN